MPDISMCATKECPLAASCYRSPESGTKPSEWRQAWSAFRCDIDGIRDAYWPTTRAKATLAEDAGHE